MSRRVYRLTQDLTENATMAKKRLTIGERQKRVQTAWNRIEDNEPDISTERPLAMVADDTGEDYGDVAALYAGENPDDL